MKLSKAARALLHKLADELRDKPRHWTKGFYAKTSGGSHCHPGSPSAVCWCLEGLFEREEHGKSFLSREYRAVKVAREAVENRVGNLVVWNDERRRKVRGVQRMLRQVANV